MRYQKLGKKLRQLRVNSGHSQVTVSHSLGYRTTQFISNWERGFSYPPIKSLAKLAVLYATSAEEIYRMIEDEIIRDVVVSMKKEFKKGT